MKYWVEMYASNDDVSKNKNVEVDGVDELISNVRKFLLSSNKCNYCHIDTCKELTNGEYSGYIVFSYRVEKYGKYISDEVDVIVDEMTKELTDEFERIKN